MADDVTDPDDGGTSPARTTAASGGARPLPRGRPSRSGRVGGVLPPFAMGPVRSALVPCLYVVMVLLVLWEFPSLHIDSWATGLVAIVLLVYLARELSVRYVVDDERLHAWRLFGWRSVALDSIAKIEAMSMRDLAPVGLSGTWGWRSRLWSTPLSSSFDAIQTYHRGLLVHGEGVPLFISPRDREAFAQELQRRVERVNPGVELVEERPSEPAPG